MALERELETFRRQLPGLLADPANRGKHALVHGDQVQGLYGSAEEALAAGYQHFGLEPFLVQEVTDQEKPQYFSHNVTRCHS
jgi:hypothetical protein